MSTNKRLVNASPDQVWAVLADGWLYPLWVVGATRIRDVDAASPETGTKIHHSIGAWPFLIDDTAEVIDSHPPAKLRLRARGWPIGEAEVEITLTADGAGTQVVMREDAVSGPGVLLPEPIKGLSFAWRNAEALRRLALIAENRAS